MDFMTNLETNALRIAELREHDLSEQCWHYILIESFSHYDYLMPIVFECNADINYRIHIYEECVIFSTADGEMLLPKLKYELEPEFVEALQLACIKYLELRNGK